MPADQNQTYEIPLPAFDMEGYQSPARTAGSLQVSNTLQDRYNGNWIVHSWNSQTEAPRWVYGTSVQLADRILDADTVERLARQVVAENRDVLRADPAQLRLTDTPHALGKWVAHFQQTWNGIDVHGATVRILFSESGKLMLMGSDYQPNIELSPVPVYSAAQATEIARSALPFNPSTDRIDGDATLLVLPVPLSASSVEHHLVWRVRVHTEEPLGAWVTHVDAHTGEIIWRYNDIHFAYLGNTSARVQVYGYCDGVTETFLPHLRIQVSGVGNVNSDAAGNWTIAGSGGPRTVTVDLYGPYVDVNNIAGSQATFSGTAQENIPLTVRFDDTNAQQDERDVFSAVNQVHDFYQLFDPSFPYANARITANVSRNSTCNAYWDGTINFYREGGGCANTGEMQQVVHHEFGHGITNSILGSQGSQGIGEGNSDIIGNLITQDPIIGRGFYLNNCTSGIRNSLNNLVYPDDVIGQQIHYAGQVIAGFNWDAMVGLQLQYGLQQGTVMSAERWHFGRTLMHPTTQPDQVLATFIADDDNDNLDDGTPNHAIYCQAAENHGFECPAVLVGVFIYHSAHPYSGDTVQGYDLTMTAVSLPQGQNQIVAGSTTIHYRVNGGSFVDAPMSATGNPDEFAGVIPAQPHGSVVEYYISALDTNNNYGTSPADAPASLHYFQVNDEFPDDMEAVTAWTAGAAGDNASAGRWIQADPVGTVYNSQPVQPEDDHTADPGHICWVTGNGSVGGAAGEADVDGGKTTLLSPSFDLTDATQVQVSYWKYYTNDKGNNPSQDYWQVGVTNDGGATWASIENTTTSTNAWVQNEFDLFTYVPDPAVVQFRFIAEDAGGGSLVEAALDDFLLAAVFNTADAEDLSVRLLTGLGQNSPNPFGPQTDIRFRLAQAGSVSLGIYDAAGRRVRSLADGSMSAGDYSLRWDGTDEAGRSLSAGVYFCRLEAGGRTFSSRMMLVK